MATVSPLKRALYVDPNEPRPSSSGSRRSQMFFKIGVLKDLALFTGKQLVWSLLFNKVAGLFAQNTSGGCFCSVLPWRFHHKRIWLENQGRKGPSGKELSLEELMEL